MLVGATAHIASLSSSVMDGTVYMTSHSLVELGLGRNEKNCGAATVGMNDSKHAESKGEVEALDKLILEIMPLNHAKSRQRILANLEHKLRADGLATETNAEGAGQAAKCKQAQTLKMMPRNRSECIELPFQDPKTKKSWKREKTRYTHEALRTSTSSGMLTQAGRGSD